MSDELLDEQRAFYVARAHEYDDWWQRRGAYDGGADDRAEFERQVAIVDEALSAFGATGDVLELAGGTGWWTERLARTADTLTVIDSSIDTLAINRDRVRRSHVRYVVADVFDWSPTRRYDVVFFSFWLSHVPRSRFSAFWRLVGSCLRLSGRVFVIDNRDDPVTRTSERWRPDPFVAEYREDMHIRQLSDGSRYRVVKVMYEPDELEAALAREGWRADIGGTRWFIYGSASPAVS
jgi:demethylmenaquinone methyltransferase/2-methoxy-6-polyprenyl-1,4-benzoquinol methylase